jgi:hypothetical protein
LSHGSPVLAEEAAESAEVAPLPLECGADVGRAWRVRDRREETRNAAINHEGVARGAAKRARIETGPVPYRGGKISEKRGTAPGAGETIEERAEHAAESIVAARKTAAQTTPRRRIGRAHAVLERDDLACGL